MSKLMRDINKDENTIEINHKHELTGKLLKKERRTIRMNIFQPTAVEKSWIKKHIRRLGVFMVEMTEPQQNRYIRIHKILKPFVLYPAFRFIKWIMSKKHFVDDDSKIVHEWYNNHIRIFNHAFHESVDDILRVLVYNQKLSNPKVNEKFVREFPTPQSYLDNFKKKNINTLHPINARHLACSVWVTEMLEDTADREMCNYLVLRMAHEVMQLYNVSAIERKKVPMPGQFPVYIANGPYNPKFFHDNFMRPIWVHPNDRVKPISYYVKPFDLEGALYGVKILSEELNNDKHKNNY